jgi:p-hydroxybenzoate 3-monooxygenase
LGFSRCCLAVARGLNSAASDIYYFYHALIGHYKKGDDAGLEGYSQKALARIWKAQQFSWWMTMLLHRLPDRLSYDDQLQQTELDCFRRTRRSSSSRNVGLPF